MKRTVIEATQVGKVFGRGPAEVRALRSIDLTLRAGELTLLMGPSGSGKTTLLSVLGCMLAPTQGVVRICGASTEGADPERLAALRREHIGFVFQMYHLFPTLTAAENVQLALDIRGDRGAQAKASSRDMLARVGLGQKLQIFPRELSGGEQQRVAIARAIVAAPSAILADEPTASLDGGTGQAIMSIIADLAKERDCAVLVVTHDTRLLPFADRVLEIEDGRLTGEHPPILHPARKRGSYA